MYLKKVEMQGFKSFADKTVIDFESGITCIIGPNGSGKSNITDALRWVLGEQKITLLRGNSMKDVIFNGTKHRKPLGMAEVSLFFDNSDDLFDIEYDIVKISRKLYRSGESKYLINGNETRLMDIRELIMGTGIGSDSYSIVSQGKINEMVTANANEMRLIFEKACGIEKYKTRKESSEKKLIKTNDNLDRIEDIVGELKKRIKPLKKESEKAKKYKETYDKLKTIEINFLADRLKKDNKNKKLINKKISDLYFKNDKIENYLKIFKKKFKKNKNLVQSLENQIENREKEFYRNNEEISKKSNSLNLKKERIDHTYETIDDTKKSIKDIEVKLKEEEKQRKKTIKDLKDLKKEIENNKSKLKEKNKFLNQKLNSFEKKENLKNEKERKINNLKQSKNKNSAIIEVKKENLNELKDKLNKNLIQKKELNHTNKKDVNEIENVENKLEKQKDTLFEITKDRELKKENLNKANKLLKKHTNKREKLKNTYQEVKTELNVLKNHEKNYVGYYHSVKKLMKHIQNNNKTKGVHGVVGSLINIDKKYEIAIEVALGSSMQNVVCDDTSIVKGLIDILKQNKFGRVSFLPLSKIFNRRINKNILKKVKTFDGFLGRANELINFNSKYAKLFNYLLGNVLIVKDYDIAKKIMDIKNIRFRTVTLEGEVFSSSGKITGGSYNSKSKGLISRKRKINTLDDKLKSMVNKGKEAKANVEKYQKNVEKIEKNIKKIDKKIVKYKENIYEKESKLEYQKNKLKDFFEKQDEINKDIENYKKKIKNHNSKIDELIEKNKSYDKSIEKLLKEITKIEKKDFGKDISQIEKKVTDLKIVIASKNEKNNNFENKLENINNRIEDYNTDLKLKSNILSDFKKRVKKLKEEKSNLKKEKLKLQDKKTELKKSLDKLKSKLKVKENTIFTLEEKIEIYSNKNKKINQKNSKNNIKMATLKANIKNIKKDLWQKYEISLFEALSLNIDKSQLGRKDEINKLKRKLKTIGSVNLNSIEEYKEVKLRYDKLVDQRDDLKKSIKSLNNIIKDLEQKMESQFIQEFNNIKNNFKEIFKTLFNGGKADIILDNKKEILETEIQIMAQPPGKSLQNLNLLSGGEKALTAIALLFSILKNKPTPFCVLDEIEAALDDANVYRFANYLNSLVKDSQFIVITHRKGTMTIADILYGVTMEEEGISKMVSLKLKDLKEKGFDD